MNTHKIGINTFAISLVDKSMLMRIHVFDYIEENIIWKRYIGYHFYESVVAMKKNIIYTLR